MPTNQNEFVVPPRIQAGPDGTVYVTLDFDGDAFASLLTFLSTRKSEVRNELTGAAHHVDQYPGMDGAANFLQEKADTEVAQCVVVYPQGKHVERIKAVRQAQDAMKAAFRGSRR